MSDRSTNYHVKKGDNLSSIARQHGHSSWRSLYDDPRNQDLRAQRSDPNQIRPGDRVVIPESALAAAQRKRDLLLKLREESRRAAQQEVASVNRQLRAMKGFSEKVDLAASFATYFVNLCGLVGKGAKAMSKTGVELAKANRELARSALKNGRGFVQSTIRGQVEVTGEEGIVLAIPKILWNSYMQMQSPSYWARRAIKITSGSDPVEEVLEIRASIQRQHDAMDVHLSRRIAEQEQVIAKLSRS